MNSYNIEKKSCICQLITIDYHKIKIVLKIDIYHWPDFLRLEKYTPTRTIRSSNETKLTVPLIKGTFQDSAEEIFKACQ